MDGLSYFGVRFQGGPGIGTGHLSYYENAPQFCPGSTSFSVISNTVRVQPFIIPENVSASILRVPISVSAVSTEVAGTSVNTSFTFQRGQTDAYVVYTQGTGANSASLQYIYSNSGTWLGRTTWTAGANGSQFTVSWELTYPIANFGTQSTDNSNYAVSSSAYNLSTGSHTRLTGPRFIDLPFATSLSAGNYWIGFGRSTSAASNAGPANLSNNSLGISTLGVSQSNISWGYPGVATNDSIQVQPGLGIYTNAAAIISTSSIGLAQISAVVSHPAMYFQLIRRA